MNVQEMKKGELIEFVNENDSMFESDVVVMLNKRSTKIDVIRAEVIKAIEAEIGDDISVLDGIETLFNIENVVTEGWDKDAGLTAQEIEYNKLSRIIVSSDEESYTMFVGEYEVCIPRVRTNDLIKDLKVGYMFIASSAELIEGDAEFKTDLEIEAYSLVMYMKKYLKDKNIERWYATLEDASDTSYATYDGDEVEYEEEENYGEGEIA